MSPTINTKPNRATLCIIGLFPRSRSGYSAQPSGKSVGHGIHVMDFGLAAEGYSIESPS
jgi:hypothetical protein